MGGPLLLLLCVRAGAPDEEDPTGICAAAVERNPAWVHVSCPLADLALTEGPFSFLVFFRPEDRLCSPLTSGTCADDGVSSIRMTVGSFVDSRVEKWSSMSTCMASHLASHDEPCRLADPPPLLPVDLLLSTPGEEASPGGKASGNPALELLLCSSPSCGGGDGSALGVAALGATPASADADGGRGMACCPAQNGAIRWHGGVKP
mmetsp:Transcript_105745/g.340961  ORF Transcript_105745/g.340961 Transcript_105745/m.340961 type:complete len:205 (+) Transcript_105745:1135-1749(+)